MDYLDGTYIYQQLVNETDITDIVGTAIYNARKIPEDETSKETINFYISGGGLSGGLDYFERTWSIDCRSDDEGTSKDIAIAVYSLLNRISSTYSGKKYFSRINIFPTLPPANDTDVYNTPVENYIRRR